MGFSEVKDGKGELKELEENKKKEEEEEGWKVWKFEGKESVLSFPYGSSANR